MWYAVAGGMELLLASDLRILTEVSRGNGRPLDEAFAIETRAAGVVMRSDDAREGPLAFMEKRKPTFTGR